jgi:catechol 2,3-dioxygenase-like lactoylglutathione lyase family enzyme
VIEPATRPALAAIAVAAGPQRWADAGFRVEGDAVRIGSVSVALRGEGDGPRIQAWSLHGLGAIELDGLPTETAEGEPGAPAPPHPNGVTALDHVVAFTPDLDRTVARLEAAGLDLRRIREGPTAAGARRQAFFRVGEPLLEVIEHPPGTRAASEPEAPARFWGLALTVPDVDEAAREMGPLLGNPRDAIQPGRRIVTFTREAGLGPAVALITP